MTDYETPRGTPPNEEASQTGTPLNISPEYVKDLLSRLKETMDVIDGSSAASPTATSAPSEATSVTEASPTVNEEDDLPPWVYRHCPKLRDEQSCHKISDIELSDLPLSEKSHHNN